MDKVAIGEATGGENATLFVMTILTQDTHSISTEYSGIVNLEGGLLILARDEESWQEKKF